MSTKYDGMEIAYTGISLVGQTLVYGSYASIFPLAVYIHLNNRRLRHLESQVMFALMVFTFTLSTSFWAMSVATYFLKIKTIAIDQVPEFARPVNSLPTIGNVVILLNLICTDVVVLWRAFTICQDLGQARIPLFIASLCLSICTFLVFAAVGIRATIIHYDIINGIADTAPFALRRSLDVMQVSAAAFPLLTNVLSTFCIALQTWYLYRSDLNGGSKVRKIMIFLVESGLVYGLSATLALSSPLIQTPHRPLGNVYGPIHAQIAGIYPAIVLVLVHQKRTIEEMFAARGVEGTQAMETMRFGSVHAQGIAFESGLGSCETPSVLSR